MDVRRRGHCVLLFGAVLVFLLYLIFFVFVVFFAHIVLFVVLTAGIRCKFGASGAAAAAA